MVHTANSRKSATAMRTGSAAGAKGPSIYILSKPLKYLERDYLTKNGAPAGSILTHNSSAYMTNETWDDFVEEFCIALRNIDEVVKKNPDWWLEWHVDGFKSKVNTLHGQATLKKYKICAVQSQSHTSQVNQAFDDLVAVESKRTQREWFANLLLLLLPFRLLICVLLRLLFLLRLRTTSIPSYTPQHPNLTREFYQEVRR